MDHLAEDIIFNIFARLPVKSLLRLKSVCKSWRSHILNSDFEKLHLVRAMTNPENHSFIAHLPCYCEQKLNLFNINFLDIVNDFKLPSKLNKPNTHRDGLNIVGSCNGLLCLCYKRNRQRLQRRLYLWNPATRQLKDITYYTLYIHKEFHLSHYASFGFGFDHASSDYKVVRIVTDWLSFVSRVEVYSLNKRSWKEIKVELKFRVIEYLHPAIVKGFPYWIVEHNPVNKQFALLSFNVHSENFSTVSLPDGMCHELPFKINIFDFKESVAVTAWSLGQYISIWTLDDDTCWIKKFTITNPDIKSILVCLKTGEFVAKISCSQLALYDSANEVVKPTPHKIFRTHAMLKLRIYNYSESLVNLN